MNKISKFSLKEFFLIIIFILFLIPFSLPGGLSANYSFVLFPILIILLNKKFYKAPILISYFFLYFVFIFTITSIYQYYNFLYLDRRFISMILFLSMFSFIFIDIDQKKIECFKCAVVIMVLSIIIIKIYKYLNLDQSLLGAGKHLIGSSRYGFVYLFAFWILIFYQPTLKFYFFLKIFGIIIILMGIFLTYSRTTMLSFIFSYGLYFFYTIFSYKNFVKSFLLMISTAIFLIAIMFFSKTYFQSAMTIYENKFFVYFSLEGFQSLLDRLDNTASSEGYRFFLLSKILNYVFSHPFTGSGFLGCWIMFENLQCSAHNQYADVLFRAGFIGFLIYIYILFKILKFLKIYHKDLFFGLTGVIIYGFFHETFKLSQGAFILTFLIGMMMTAQRKKIL